MPVIVRVDSAGKISEVPLDNIKYSSVSLPDGPQGDRQRMETITSIKYVNGQVFVAGLSNEEFSSSLRSIPYPFRITTRPPASRSSMDHTGALKPTRRSAPSCPTRSIMSKASSQLTPARRS
jgi:hypothetical protein